MKVLINVPNLSLPGGVTSLFNLLKLDKLENVEYFIVNFNKKKWGVVFLPFVYLKFVLSLKSVDIVHVNPSLNKKSFIRDACFSWLTLLFNKKLIVYWHGWQDSYENKIAKSYFLKFILRRTFFKAHVTIALGKVFENKLLNMGYKNKIVIETNSAENKYIIEQRPKTIYKLKTINLLFLSRLENEKGIYIAIDTVEALNKLDDEREYFLDIAGTGSEETNIKKICEDSIYFRWHGYATGELKHKLLSESNILFFPTFYPEGMPLTLLEGMIYGLPIVSRPVGGISDLIEHSENGIILTSLDFEDFLRGILLLVNNSPFYDRISVNNLKKSKMFMPSEVQARLLTIYENVFYEKKNKKYTFD